jgi:integrase
MTIREVYSPADQARIDQAEELGKPKPRAKPIYVTLRGRLGGRRGIQVNRRYASRREAEQAWKDIEADWEETKRRGCDPIAVERASRMTLREFVREYYIPNYLMQKTAPGSHAGARRHLDLVILPTLGDLPLRRIHRLTIDNWITDLATLEFPQWRKQDSIVVGKWRRGEGPKPTPIGWAPKPKKQQAKAVAWLKSVLRYAFDVEAIRKDPAEHVEISRKQFDKGRRRQVAAINNDKPVEPWIIERVRMEMSPRDRTILRVLYVQGNRPHELTAWTWLDVRDPDTGQIRNEMCIEVGVSADVLWDTKTYRSRQIKMFEPAREALEEWLDERTRQLGRVPLDDELVFPILSKRGKRVHLNISNWGSITLQAACRRAGVAAFNQYRMRATCCALLAAGGDEQPDGEIKPWPLPEVAYHLGHSVQTCEEHYLGLFKNRGKYRRLPIEQAVRAGVEEAREARDAWIGELREMAETLSYSEIADLLNEGPMQPPRQRAWTKASARDLLIRHGIHMVVSADRNERNVRTLARLRELAATQTPSQIAKSLNEEGHPLLRRDEGKWTREYVVAVLSRAGVTPHIRNADYHVAKARLRELAGSGTYKEIADVLNSEGHLQKSGEKWLAHNVGVILRRMGVRSLGEPNPEFEASCGRLIELSRENHRNNPELAKLMNAEGHRGKWGDAWTPNMVGDVLRAAGLGAGWKKNEDFREAVALLAQMAKAEAAYAEIAHTLNEAGHLTFWSRRWTENAVYTTLKREGLFERRRP